MSETQNAQIVILKRDGQDNANLLNTFAQREVLPFTFIGTEYEGTAIELFNTLSKTGQALIVALFVLTGSRC